MLQWKLFLVLLAIPVLFYIVVGALLWFFQEKFIFYPTKLSPNYTFPDLPDHEEVWLENTEDQKLHGLYFKAKEDQGLVLYFHGNAGGLEKWGHMATPLLEFGYSVFIIDYREFGKSVGPMTEKVMKADAEKAYQWALKQYEPNQIIALGRSLGTGLASWLASREEFKLLILETPYTSLFDMAKLKFGWLPINSMIRINLDNINYVGKVNCPVYIIHGTHDELIPYRMAQKVAEKNGTLITIENGTHNDLSTFAKYNEEISKIFKRHG